MILKKFILRSFVSMHAHVGYRVSMYTNFQVVAVNVKRTCLRREEQGPRSRRIFHKAVVVRSFRSRLFPFSISLALTLEARARGTIMRRRRRKKKQKRKENTTKVQVFVKNSNDSVISVITAGAVSCAVLMLASLETLCP